MELVITRGLPGAGKSTYIKTHFPHHKHFEADMYFSRNGEYKFDPTELNAAHRWCQNAVYDQLCKGKDVAVSNTFIQDWEFEPYMVMADELGISVRVIELRTMFGSIHGVPESKMIQMRNRWHNWEDIKKQFPEIEFIYEVIE